MKLGFPVSALADYASRFPDGPDPFPVAPKIHLTKEEFLAACRWKTPRSAPLCRKNSEELVADVTRVAFSRVTGEELRIRVCTLLEGVSFPTASVLLHFFHPDPYPILDVRALWSVGVKKPVAHTFALWSQYTSFCRAIAAEAGVSMRVLDKALWQFSAEKQRGLARKSRTR